MYVSKLICVPKEVDMFPVHISMYTGFMWNVIRFLPQQPLESQGRCMRVLFQRSFVYSQALCCHNNYRNLP